MKALNKIAFLMLVSLVATNVHAGKTGRRSDGYKRPSHLRQQKQQAQQTAEYLQRQTAQFESQHPRKQQLFQNYSWPSISRGQKTILLGLALMLLMTEVNAVATRVQTIPDTDTSVSSIPDVARSVPSTTDPQAESVLAEKISPEIIEFGGIKKPILGHIVQAQFNPETDPFSVTSVVIYKENRFILKGDILALSEDDLNDIANGNFVYVPFYTRRKTRLGNYQELGAIIVGSSDPSLGDALHFAANY
jgi:hypothetical protein